MLVGILGGLGSGKTLLMSILAYLSQEKNIVSNYNLNNLLKEFPNKNIESFEFSSVLKDYVSCNMFLDEIYVYVESRGSGNDMNLIMSYMLLQSRKQSVNIFFTAQLLSSIDVRFRSLIDVFIYCEKENNRFKYTILTLNGQKIWYLSFKKAEYFYKFYDTNEVVKSSRLQAIQDKNLSEKDIKKKIKEVIPLFHEFKSEYPSAKIIKSFVKLFCRRKQLPITEVFVTSLLYSLKEKEVVKS